MRRSLFLFLTLVCMAAGALPGAAQTTFGTIRGTVFDPQQGIVPGATVVATDETTNVSREAQSDAEGQFEIPNLRPGTYTVTASLSGFKKSQTTGAGAARDSGRPRGFAPRSRRPRGRGHRPRRRAEQHHAREPGDRPRDRRAAASRPSPKQPRRAGLPHAQPQHRRRLRRHPVPRRPHLRRVVYPGRPAVERGNLRRTVERGTWAGCDPGSAGAVEFVQRRVRRPRGRHRVDQARRKPVPWHGRSPTSTRTS